MNFRKSALTGALVLVCLAGSACGQDSNNMQARTYIDGRSASDEGVPPFSGAVMAGDTLYISGTLGLVDGKVPDDPKDEVRNILDSIKGTLEKAGMSWDDVVLTQVFCSDVSNYGAFNEVYRGYFNKEFPARAFIGSGTLLFNARFEVMAIASKH